MARRKPQRSQPQPSRPKRTRFGLAIAVGLVMATLVVVHLPYINGAYYFQWGWQRLDFWRAWPGVVIAAVPFVLAQLASRRTSDRDPGRARTMLALAGLMATTFVLEVNALVIAAGRQAGERLWRLVEDEWVAGYYSDAIMTSRVIPTLKDWLRLFPEYMSRLHIHSRNKPPGSILYYLTFVHQFGVDGHRAASAAGLGLGLLATAAIPAVYFFARAAGTDRRAALLASSAMALCPAFSLFFPEFDQSYAAASAVLLGTWVLSLRRDSNAWAVASGLTLAALLFFTFNLLVLGWFMAAAALYLWRTRACSLARAIVSGAIVLGAVGVTYGGLWLATGYDPIAVFRISLANQAAFAADSYRPYPQTALFDLLDYALGLGWMTAVIFVASLSRRSADASADRAFSWIGATQLLVVAVGALIPVETARVWMFMMPLALPAVGRELARWSDRQRAAFFVLAAVTVVLIGQNMTFFSLSPNGSR